jgi:hypothetical protein
VDVQDLARETGSSLFGLLLARNPDITIGQHAFVGTKVPSTFRNLLKFGLKVDLICAPGNPTSIPFFGYFQGILLSVAIQVNIEYKCTAAQVFYWGIGKSQLGLDSIVEIVG